MTGVKVFLICRYWQENWRFGKTKRLRRCRLAEEVDRQPPILGSCHCTRGKWGHDRGYVEVSLQPHTRHPRGAQWSLPGVCPWPFWTKKRGTKSGCNLVGKFGFLFYKKSLLLVSYFFISILICSIKGLWKADRHPYKQVSTERHQDAVASVSNLLSRSPAQFGYHICS